MESANEQKDHIGNSILECARVIAGMSGQVPLVAEISRVVIAALDAGCKLLTMGHGGSAADALHMSEELLGRFDADRRPLPAVSLVADPTLMTCIANDYGFERVFARQIEGLGVAGDVLFVFSTSGKGEGIRLAVEAAKAKNVICVGILGKGGGPIADQCDYALIIDSDQTARIQEAHTLVLHLILELADRHFSADH